MSASDAVAARTGAGPVKVLAPQPGAVIIAPTAARAHRLRLTARLSIPRRVRGLGLRLNGDRIRLPARPGRVRVVLDAANGLVVGENLLWATVRGIERNPTVRFVVGYRHPRALGIHLRLGAGILPAATARLRTPRTSVDRLSVTLNGVPLRVPPEGVPSGRLVLDLAQLGPARWGVNRVRVRLIMMDGRIADWTRTFRLDRRRDVAVARLHGKATVGHAVVLDASRSLIVPGVGRARGVRWVLLRRPVLSHARLGKPKGTRIALRPDVPGHYLVGLRVGCGSRSGYDVATVAATYDEPLVPLDTIHYAQAPPPAPGLWGVKVGESFYASNGDAVQVLVLDRATLGLIANTGYQGTAQSFDAMEGYFKTLPSSDLVIVTHTGTESAAPLPSDSLSDLDNALHAIGGNLGARWQLMSPCWSGATQGCSQSTKWQESGLSGGSFSVVGVPGMTRGQAWRETAAQAGTQDGSLTGYLTLGTVTTGGSGLYTVINGPQPYVPADTCTPDGCAVKVGEQTYPAAPGVSGIHVVVLNGTTLQLIANRTVTTTADLDSAVSAVPSGGVGSVSHFILYGNGPFIDQRLVILESVGDGRLTGAPSNDLIEKIDQLGGTPEFLLASITGAHRYALVGAATDLPWHATSIESSTAMTDQPPGTPGQPTGQVSGVVGRGRDGVYTPAAGDAVGPTNVALYSILYQRPVAWPMAGDPGLKYIADNIGMSGHPDVRSAYPDTNINFASKNALLGGLACTGGPDVCGPNYAALKNELQKEFDWVMSVRGLADNLRAPYVETATGSDYFDVGAVTDDIKKSVPVDDSSDVLMQFLGIFQGVMTVGQNVSSGLKNPEAAAAFGVAGAAAVIATKLIGQPDGEPADSVSTTAAQLSKKMYDQQTAYLQWVNHQFADTVVADYGKLSAVGIPAGGGDPSWDVTGETANRLIDALRGGTRASAYSALMPVAWGGFNLKPGANQTSSNDVTSLICDEPYNYPNHHYPFAAALPQNQFHAATGYSGNPPQAIDEVWTFAKIDHSWSKDQAAYADMPTDSRTDNIYGPQSTSAATGAFQYGPSWWRSTYNPPGHATCGKGTSDMDVNQVWSQNYPPPPIRPPLP